MTRRFERLFPRSLSSRVFILYGATLIVVLTVLLGLFLSQQYRQQVLDTQRGAAATIEVMAQSVQDSVVIGDYDTVKRTLDRAVRGSIFSGAVFIDLSGGRIVSRSRTPGESRPPGWFNALIAAQFIDENTLIVVGGVDYGVLRLEFDTDYVAAEMWTLSMQVILGTMLALVAGLFAIRLLITRSLSSLRKLEAFELAMAAGELESSRLELIDAPEEFERIITMVRRAAELSREREVGRRALDNQKFALDQHAIVSITDLSGRITYANDRFCEITGYAREELIGQDHRLVNSGTHAREFFAGLWNTISAGRVWHGEICNRARSGDTYWVSATIVPLLGADGRPEQYIAIRTDISDRKRIESSLLASKEAAEQASLTKSRFLANVSHEIRTPLNAVLGMLRLLRLTALTPQQTDYLVKSEGAARSLQQLLSDILDFSKIEADRLTLEARPLHLDRVLRDLSVILSAGVGSKSLEVLFDIEPGMPRLLVGDELRLQQVLINLGANAIKFTERGEVVISVRMTGRGDRDVRLRFAVRDTGIGIPEDKLRDIFDGFTQAEASTTRRYGGTGLGLAISKRLVDLMGGEIAVESAPGKGSTFSFEISLSLPEAASAEAVEACAPAAPQPWAQALRILIVDDNEMARTLLADMARSLGWRVDVAADGFEAIAMSRSAARSAAPFDVAFVDWQMPGMDGWETSLQLRAGPDGGPRLVMMVTAHGREMLSQRTTAEQAGLGGFLVKPVTASMLHDAVADAWLGREGAVASDEVGAPPRRRLEGMRLLVVEDNANNRQVARELLAFEGAQVDLAEDGEQGVRAVLEATSPYDAVLMDVQMPVLDGYGATARIRAEARVPPPIIAMTANALESDRAESLAAGMVDHIGKPFDLEVLVRALLEHAGAGRQPAGATGAASRRVEVAGPADRAAPATLSGPALAAAGSAGVDLRAAVARVGGRADVYARMLRTFCGDLPGIVSTLRQAADAGRSSEVAAAAHSLKGVGAMVGASALQALSAEIETVCASPEGPSAGRVPGLLSAIEAAASRFLAEAQGLVAALDADGRAADASGPPLALDSNALPALLRELATTLEDSDMRALDLVERLAADVGADGATRVAPLRASVEALDFEAGARQCRDWLGALGR